MRKVVFFTIFFCVVSGLFLKSACLYESRVEYLRFQDCLLTEVSKGGGASDSGVSAFNLKCGGRPEETILSARRLRGEHITWENNRLIIRYAAGEIDDYQNHYYLEGLSYIRIDLVRIEEPHS